MYCTMCFQIQHRKGKRAGHSAEPRLQVDITRTFDFYFRKDFESDSSASIPVAILVTPVERSNALGLGNAYKRLSAEWFIERAKYIPVRLTHKERHMVRL